MDTCGLLVVRLGDAVNFCQRIIEIKRFGQVDGAVIGRLRHPLKITDRCRHELV